MSDKELIKQEIERRYNCEKCYPLDRESNVAAAVLQEMLLFIDSLQEENASEDLEEAARKWEDKVYLENGWQDECGTPHAPFSEIGNAFMAGAEWQKNQMKEALQTEYEKGRFDMREEIMKDAVDGEYWDGSIYLDNRPTEYKDGDKVKIIIVKEN